MTCHQHAALGPPPRTVSRLGDSAASTPGPAVAESGSLARSPGHAPIPGWARAALLTALASGALSGLAIAQTSPPVDTGWDAARPPAAIRSDGRLPFLPPPADGFVPYWSFDANTKANLDIANRSPTASSLELTALVGGRFPVALGGVELPARQVVRVAVDERLAAARTAGRLDGTPFSTDGGETWGSLLLYGDVETLSAWLLMENQEESLSFNTMMARPGQGSQSVVAQWWSPTEATRIAFVVQNTGSAPTAVRAEAAIGGKRHRTTSQPLIEGESVRFELAALAQAWGLDSLPPAGQIRLVADAGASIVARTFASDPRVGFSSPLMPHDLTRRIGFELQTPGVPLGAADPATGFPAGTVFHPTLLVSNTTEHAMEADVYLQAELYPDAEPVRRPISLSPPAPEPRPFDPFVHPELQPMPAPALEAFEVLPAQTWGEVWVATLPLEPGETRVLDLLEAARQRDLEATEIGVRLDAKGGTHPGSLIADLISVDETLTYSFYDPMFDTAIPRTNRTEVSFDLTDTKTAHLLFKNTSVDEPANARVSIHFRDGELGPGTYELFRRLTPMELWRIDIEKLRDERVPDQQGRLLPEDMTFGFATATTSGHVLGADPTFDPVHGTCASCEDENPFSCPRTIPGVPFSSCFQGTSWVWANLGPQPECQQKKKYLLRCLYSTTIPCGATFGASRDTYYCEGWPVPSCTPTYGALIGTYTLSIDPCALGPSDCSGCIVTNGSFNC